MATRITIEQVYSEAELVAKAKKMARLLLEVEKLKAAIIAADVGKSHEELSTQDADFDGSKSRYRARIEPLYAEATVIAHDVEGR